MNIVIAAVIEIPTHAPRLGVRILIQLELELVNAWLPKNGEVGTQNEGSDDGNKKLGSLRTDTNCKMLYSYVRAATRHKCVI